MDTPEDCATIQNDLKKLEKLAKKNPELPKMEVKKTPALSRLLY